MPEPLLMKIQDPVVRGYMRHKYLNARRYKYGWVGAKTGRSRAGKTETNILESVLLSRKGFDMRSVAWKPKQYAEVVNDAKKGEPIVWSEVGRGLNARKWQSLQNIISGELMQIMQLKKLILFIDVINLAFVDTQIRNMIREYCEVFRPVGQPTYMNVYGVKNNYMTGTTYYPHPLVKTEDGFFKLRRITFHTRLKEIAPKVYDDFKQIEKKDKLDGMQRAAEQLRELGGKNGEEMNALDYVEEFKDDPKAEEKYKNKFGRWDKHLIKAHRKLKPYMATEIAALLNNDALEKKPSKKSKTEKLN